MSSFESIFLQIASLQNEFILFSIVISFPSIILYMAEIWTILWNKKFHNSFYALIVVRAILNLIYTLDSYLGYRLPILVGHFLLPIFMLLPNWGLCMFFFLSSCSLVADYLATFFIILNRWTAIKMATRHKIIWRKLLPIALFIVLLIPPALNVGDFNLVAFIQMEEDSSNGQNNTNENFYIGTKSNNESTAKEIPYGVIFSCAFMVVSVYFNASTIAAYRKHRTRIGPANLTEQSRQRVEHRLFVYALLTFLGHALMACIQILTYVVQQTNNEALVGAIYTQYPWTMDLGSVVLPSWLLFWASEEFRRQLIAQFVPKWTQNIWKALWGKVASMSTGKWTTTTSIQNLADCQTIQMKANGQQSKTINGPIMQNNNNSNIALQC